MANLIIRLKSGFELPIECDHYKFGTIEGELTSYKLSGITNFRPVFFRLEDVECIYEVLKKEDSFSEHKNPPEGSEDDRNN